MVIAHRKNKELSPEELLTEICKELSKKHTEQRARRKKDSVPSVSQMQNHMSTGTWTVPFFNTRKKEPTWINVLYKNLGIICYHLSCTVTIWVVKRHNKKIVDSVNYFLLRIMYVIRLLNILHVLHIFYVTFSKLEIRKKSTSNKWILWQIVFSSNWKITYARSSIKKKREAAYADDLFKE